ncbi:tetratricopeptide repeat protein [Gimesia maris]|uniref:tetratricopeptide repeat protein n=1 Tax=Gimesia maris TaxID=122 RepID=UPI0032ED11A6
MKKRSKNERKKNEKKKNKAKRKLKEKQKRKQQLDRRIFAGQAGRKVLRDEVYHPRSLRSKAEVVTIDSVRPGEEDDCLCGSRLKFGDCCASRLHEGSKAMTTTYRLLDNNQQEAALLWCRVHLCWYILCHRAHTVPRLKMSEPIAGEILTIDIEALNENLRCLNHCYRVTGQGESFPHVLDAMDGVVMDQRWADKLMLFRALWWELEKNDPIQAAQCIAEIDVDACNDADVLAKYVTLHASQLPFDERVKLMERVCELTDEQEIKLQFRCLIGISYFLVCEKEKAIELITSAVDRYRLLLEEDRSLFGDHLFANALFMLGSMQDSDELVAESEKCFANFLGPERATTLTPFAKGDYLMHVGRCKAFLGDHPGAIEQYDKSLSIYDQPLARIYKAEALVSRGELDAGRELLENINREAISLEERHDYAMARTMLAVATQLEKDIENAKHALKAFETSEPLWTRQRDKWLITLLETVPTANAGWIVKMIRRLNRYAILQPNIFGLGINLNNVLEDITQRGE